MKTTTAVTFGLALLGAGVGSTVARPLKPNIIFILADDLA